MICLILIITITCINCFENIKMYSISNNLHKLFGEISNNQLGEISNNQLGEISNNQLGEISNNQLGEISNNQLDNNEIKFGKNKSFYEPIYVDSLVSSYHKWLYNINEPKQPNNKIVQEENKDLNNKIVQEENKDLNNKILQEELKKIYKDNFHVFKKIAKHNKQRNNKYLK